MRTGIIGSILNMTSYKPSDIVLVKFPFSNLEENKKRPALVLCVSKIAEKQSLLSVAMITSQIEGLEINGDILIRDWKESHLLHPSKLRLSKIATLDDFLVQKKIGQLSSFDKKQTQSVFQKLYKVWIA